MTAKATPNLATIKKLYTTMKHILIYLCAILFWIIVYATSIWNMEVRIENIRAAEGFVVKLFIGL
jgi:hypothetical protein